MSKSSEASYKRYVQYQNNRFRYRRDQQMAPFIIAAIGIFITKYWVVILTLLVIYIMALLYLREQEKREQEQKEQNKKELERLLQEHAEKMANKALTRILEEATWEIPQNMQSYIKKEIKRQIYQIQKERPETSSYTVSLKTETSTTAENKTIHELKEVIVRAVNQTDGTPDGQTVVTQKIDSNICQKTNQKHSKQTDSTMSQKRKENQKMKGKTTVAGYVNDNKQKNNGITEFDGTDYNQKLYSMECLECGHHYYANGSDIHLRKCPNCMGGRP